MLPQCWASVGDDGPPLKQNLRQCLMLGQRQRRWPNIKTTLVQHLVMAGTLHDEPCMLLF